MEPLHGIYVVMDKVNMVVDYVRLVVNLTEEVS